MTEESHRLPERVLAIDPTTRGFGFVVMEGAENLLDWGVVHVRKDKREGTLRRIGALLDWWHPDMFVLEDASAEGSLRRDRVRELLDDVAEVAMRRGVMLGRVSRQRVGRAFKEKGAANKHEIARVIVERMPELKPRIPPRRKAWMSEDERMAIFDAAALALTFVAMSSKRRAAKAREAEDGRAWPAPAP